MNDGPFLEHDRSYSKCYQDGDKNPSDIEVTLHASPSPFTDGTLLYTIRLRSPPVILGNMKSRIITPIAVAAWFAAMTVMLSSTARAHEIPNDVTVQAFIKPSGDRLHMLVRVPLKAMRDIIFP